MWFTDWFDALTQIQQIFACLALPATVLLVIQTVLLIFGLGADGDSADGDCDCDSCQLDGDVDDLDGGVDDAVGLRIFTIRGLVAMFSIGGWLGIAAVDLGANNLFASLIAIGSGILALFLVAYIIKLLLKLQENGNLDPKNAIARTARVYITIPSARSGTGKVMLTLQERLVEMDAVTDYSEAIKTDSMVQVVSLSDGVLVVRPLSDK